MKEAGSLVRLKPFDGSSAEGRSKERHRRVVLTAAASALGKAIAVLTALVSVPLTYNYLGAERYGMWMTMSSAIALLNFADFGLAGGVLNRVTEAYGKNDSNTAGKYHSTGIFLLSGIAVVFASTFYVTFPYVAWSKLFNVSSPEALAELGPTLSVFVACMALSMPMAVFNRVRLACQEGFVNSIWTGLGNLMGLGGVLLGIRCQAGLPWLVLAMAGAPVIANLLNGASLFRHGHFLRRPSWEDFDRDAVASLFSTGLLFFVVQVAFSVAYTTDNLVVAHFMGAKAVALYAVVTRLFGFAPMVMEMFLSPLWPAYGEAIVRKDFAWVRSTLRRSLALSVVFAAGVSSVLVVGGNAILAIWVSPEVQASLWLLLGFGIWMVVSVAGSALAMFLNGTNSLKVQAICGAVMASTALILKVMLADRFGLVGMIWITLICYILLIAVPMVFYVPRLVRKMQTC